MRLHWLLCLFALLAAPASAGQKQNLITIGDSRISKGTFNGSDEKPFLAALAAMNSTHGGQIEVLPGRYRFKNTVPLTHPGITVRGSRASVIDGVGLSSSKHAFHVIGDGAVIDGLRFLASNKGKSGSLIRVEGDDFTLTHCRFDVLNSKSEATDTYRLVHALPGPGAKLTNRHGLLVQGNSFVFGTGSGGVVGLESQNSRSLRLTDNEFVGPEDQNGMGSIGTAVLLRNGEWATISGNTFLRLSAPTASGDDTNAILASINSGKEEGHHLSITGNFFEVLEGRAVINLAGGTFNVISGNVFGRTNAPDGCVRLKEAPMVGSAAPGTGNVISGNQFHHNSAGFASPFPAIVVRHQEQVSITNNQFTECTGPQVIIGSDTTTTYGAFVCGNQFHARDCEGNPAISEAIQFRSGGSHFVGSNVALKDGNLQGNCGWMDVYNLFGTATVKVGGGNEVLP